MCLTSVGRVISVEDGQALVDLDGLQRRAMSLMIPDLRPGELVLVGLGTVLGRVDLADHEALERIQPATSQRLPTSPPRAMAQPVPTLPPDRPTP